MPLKQSRLIVRTATPADIEFLVEASKEIYGGNYTTAEMFRAQQRAFPEGQFIVEYEEKVAGYCVTFIVDKDVAFSPHSWDEITGHGFAARHNPKGEYLYGMEVGVVPKFRNLRIGQRLYDARKNLCQDLELKGIIFGGRIPEYHKHAKKGMTPLQYLENVQAKKLRDPVTSFQLRNHFEIIGVLPQFLPHDKESCGYAAHLLWRNPLVPDVVLHPKSQRGRQPDSVRVASVQFQARAVENIEQFEEQVEYFVDVAADYRADFILFPELLTIPLLSIEKKKLSPEEGIRSITSYTERFIAFMQQLALSYNVNIIGGSHPTLMENGDLQNICYIFLRDGSVHSQPKIHPTPTEKYWWNVKGGNTLHAIDTDCGTIGVLICYDSEFPELGRYLADQGVTLLFVPFCTDEKQGYQRVRYCCQARAIENQMYVTLAGLVGNLPAVENMDIHYAESCILTPCDFPFARDGIAASSAPNTEMIVFADLRLDDLMLSRNSGTVQNLKDRRFDLYKVEWKGKHSIT